jgi:predicted amidophosphoribosyltransferase
MNKCKWLIINSLETCNKNCRGDYCHSHNQYITNVPKPCKKCGRGTTSAVQKCVPCSPHKELVKLNIGQNQEILFNYEAPLSRTGTAQSNNVIIQFKVYL